jgi:hypothetical protein
MLLYVVAMFGGMLSISTESELYEKNIKFLLSLRAVEKQQF